MPQKRILPVDQQSQSYHTSEKPESAFKNTGVSATKFIQLEDSNAILKMAPGLYQNNLPVESKILPPLVNQYFG